MTETMNGKTRGWDGLGFHHVGLACADLDAEERVFARLGYTREGPDFEDPVQGIRGRFLVGAGPRLELLCELPTGTVLGPWLRKGVKMYHVAYEAVDLAAADIAVTAFGARRVVAPVPAVAFGGRRIAFYMMPNGFLIELIEAPSVSARWGSAADLLATAARRVIEEPRRLLAALAVLDPAACFRSIASGALTGLSREAVTSILATALSQVGPDMTAEELDTAAVALNAHANAVPPDELARTISTLVPERVQVFLRTVLPVQLERHATHPGLLRAAVALAIGAGETDRAHMLLTRLGLAELTPATAAFIHTTRGRLPELEGLPTRVALLSSFTVAQLTPFVDLMCRSLGLVPEIYVAPFNSWMREMVDEGAGLRGFNPHVAFLSVALDDLVPELVGSLTPKELAAAGDEALGRVVAAVERFRGWSREPVVVHGFHSAFNDPAGVRAGREHLSRSQWLGELNAQLAERLRALPGCYMLDMVDLLSRIDSGADAAKMRHLAAIRLPAAVLPEVARAYARYISPRMGLTRKCVVVDLDNTLWGGIVGEDGPNGIRLGHTAPGSEYVEFQQFLATLPQRGIILAVNSKNNVDDAMQVIQHHEAMVLRETAFSALRINWLPKPENMASIAEELGIGVESFVFVDDNPEERQLMRHVLPQVLTVEMPRDPALYRATLEALPELQTLEVTGEDRARVGQYRAKREREQMRMTMISLEEYLHSLGIRVMIAPCSEANLSRVAQLFQRTNQFNVTTRRHDAPLLAQRMTDPEWRLYTLRAGDRFSDHGLVAIAIARLDVSAWTVESFLMSCRVISYGIETALLAVIAEDAVAHGATRLYGEFVPTKKNQPARDLYERHGFVMRETIGGVERWERSLVPVSIAFPAWIARESDVA
jgi:FkbH-like protein